ncbi:hypothetical protein BDQ17DRAFT_1327947 [Cyathus striatus]|nr:hypothetical protein BDQ17DRAFT_1327947 [Cyathus striatus]
MLKKDDSKQQLVYYQAGIGTYTIPQIAKPMMAKFYKALDSMVGIHLNAHVMNLFGFEVRLLNFTGNSMDDAGDKIYLFDGARALAGTIHKVGPKPNYTSTNFNTHIEDFVFQNFASVILGTPYAEDSWVYDPC